MEEKTDSATTVNCPRRRTPPEWSQSQLWKRDASFGICKILNSWTADKYFHAFMHMKHLRPGLESKKRRRISACFHWRQLPLGSPELGINLIVLPVCAWITWRRIKHRRAAGTESREGRAKVQEKAGHMGFHPGLLRRSALKLLHLFTV